MAQVGWTNYRVNTIESIHTFVVYFKLIVHSLDRLPIFPALTSFKTKQLQHESTTQEIWKKTQNIIVKNISAQMNSTTSYNSKNVDNQSTTQTFWEESQNSFSSEVSTQMNTDKGTQGKSRLSNFSIIVIIFICVITVFGVLISIICILR